jgi:DNA-binding transcriptional ArsR family regulator
MDLQSPDLPEFLRLAASRFQALADPNRLLILMTLKARGEIRVNDITSATGQSQPAVSKNLGILRQAGLVQCRRDGTSMLYALRGDTVHVLCETVCKSLEEEHGQFTAAIRAAIPPRSAPARKTPR